MTLLGVQIEGNTKFIIQMNENVYTENDAATIAQKKSNNFSRWIQKQKWYVQSGRKYLVHRFASHHS